MNQNAVTKTYIYKSDADKAEIFLAGLQTMLSPEFRRTVKLSAAGMAMLHRLAGESDYLVTSSDDEAEFHLLPGELTYLIEQAQKNLPMLRQNELHIVN